MLFYVYALFRPTGVVCYIGKGSGNRIEEHDKKSGRNSKSANKHLMAIIRKAKVEGLEIPKIIVRDGLTESEAFYIERTLIEVIGREDLRTGPLVNQTNGGEGFSGGHHSVETKFRMSNSNKAMVFTDSHRAKISASLKGRKITWKCGVRKGSVPWNKGKRSS